MLLNTQNIALKLFLSLILVGQLSACVPVVVGGAAAGGAMVSDRRTSGIYVEDENIELKALKMIETSIGSTVHINVTSYNRNVLLTGEAPSAEVKSKAETMIKNITNIRGITNEIVVGEKSTISSRSNDAYLTTKVKTQFVTENKFSANFVKVVTENNVVYLLGIVTKPEADAAAEIASNTNGVSKVVKLFEYQP
ncbi:OsmY Predicted periplasmic or secreted lipoprotein [Methylophilaceae bacterium]